MNSSGAGLTVNLVCFGLTLVACARDEVPTAGADNAPEPSGPTLTACALVTRDAGVTALGEEVDDPVEQIVHPGSAEMAALSQCAMQASATPAKSLALFLRRSPVADNRPDSVRETLAQSGITAEDVSGLGEAAFWAAGELHVFVRGNLYFTVNVRGLDDALALERASAVARSAIERAGGR